MVYVQYDAFMLGFTSIVDGISTGKEPKIATETIQYLW